MKFILTLIGGKELILNQEQARKVMFAVELPKGQAPLNVTIDGDKGFAMSAFSSIMSAEEYLESENRQLAKRDRWMCGDGEVHGPDFPCNCSSFKLLSDDQPQLEAPTKIEWEEIHTAVDGTKTVHKVSI